MITCEVALALLPEASVAVQVTVVVPSLKDVGVYEIVGDGSTESLAVACVSVGLAGTLVTVNDCEAGGVIEGGVVSTIVTVKVLVTVVPPSSALHVTVLAPRAKVAPEAGVQVTESGVELASVAATEKEAVAPEALVASIV